jgi:hypothetical protein
LVGLSIPAFSDALVPIPDLWMCTSPFLEIHWRNRWTFVSCVGSPFRTESCAVPSQYTNILVGKSAGCRSPLIVRACLRERGGSITGSFRSSRDQLLRNRGQQSSVIRASYQRPRALLLPLNHVLVLVKPRSCEQIQQMRSHCLSLLPFFEKTSGLNAEVLRQCHACANASVYIYL